MDATAVSIYMPTGILTICNIYSPNKFAFSLNDLSNLITQLLKSFLLLGDFNSHSHSWESSKLDSRGKIIEQLLENSNLILLNQNKPTHYNNSYKFFSSIDLSICNTQVAQQFEWCISSNPQGSDHFPILISMLHPNLNTTNTPNPSKWKFHKEDWNTYKKIISNEIKSTNFHNAFNNSNINTKLQVFTDLLLLLLHRNLMTEVS